MGSFFICSALGPIWAQLKRTSSSRRDLTDICAHSGMTFFFSSVGFASETLKLSIAASCAQFLPLSFGFSSSSYSFSCDACSGLCPTLIRTGIRSIRYHHSAGANFLAALVFVGIGFSVVLAVTVFNLAFAMRVSCII